MTTGQYPKNKKKIKRKEKRTTRKQKYKIRLQRLREAKIKTNLRSMEGRKFQIIKLERDDVQFTQLRDNQSEK